MAASQRQIKRFTGQIKNNVKNKTIKHKKYVKNKTIKHKKNTYVTLADYQPYQAPGSTPGVIFFGFKQYFYKFLGIQTVFL